MLNSRRPIGRPRNDGTTFQTSVAVTPPAVASAICPPVPHTPVVWTPEQVLDPLLLDVHLLQAVVSLMPADRPQNSINVKDPKIQEFKDYFKDIYPDRLMRWGL